MNTMLYICQCVLLICLYCLGEVEGALLVGVGKADITPIVGTPSAGYIAPKRKMRGIHDPLLATAIVIDNGEKKIAICAVDNLGLPHAIVEDIRSHFPHLEIIIASSHTHSGGGAYLDIPIIGEMMAGTYDPRVRRMLVEQTVQAIKKALYHAQEAMIGVGYGRAPGLNMFRSSWPQEATPPEEVAVIKCTLKSGEPLAIIYHYATHPTVLSASNTLYSADFVAYARKKIEKDAGVVSLYLNGAQADVAPKPPYGQREYDKCRALGEAVAEAVLEVASHITTRDTCAITFSHYPYSFPVQPSTSGLKLPVETYETELNLLVLNGTDAFITVPGELSCLYIGEIQEKSPFLHTSLVGLVNDAHGYIITPDAYQHMTKESAFCFGGPNYGDWMVKQLISMLREEGAKRDSDLY